MKASRSSGVCAAALNALMGWQPFLPMKYQPLSPLGYISAAVCDRAGTTAKVSRAAKAKCFTGTLLHGSDRNPIESGTCGDWRILKFEAFQQLSVSMQQGAADI